MAAKTTKNLKNKQTPTAMQPRAYDRLIISVSIIGVLLSTYALYVEMAVEARPGYKAMCDISAHASCSKVLTSDYAKGFGLKTLNLPSFIDDNSLLRDIKDVMLEVPNCILGILFYCLMIFLTTFDNRHMVLFQFLLGLTAFGSSIYLAYILVFILKDICVVCVATYVVNFSIAVFTFKKSKNINEKLKKQ